MMKKLFLFCITFFALTVHTTWTNTANPLYPATLPPEITARAAALIDAETGTVLFLHNFDTVIAPASLAKLMTLHLAQRAIRQNKTTADKIAVLPPETWADNQPPRSSLMFLARNQTVTLGELLLGLAVSSGNDAAVAVALNLAPSMEAFIAMMNAEAGRLGLVSTHFVEPAGISPENTTAALDFARFCRAYIAEHPQSLALLHSVQHFAYPLPANTGGGPTRTIVQYNRNTLLNTLYGVDGLKTGYINEAGYNIALTAKRGQTRFIAVLLGAENEDARDKDGEALLEWGFANFRTLFFDAAFLPHARIWCSKEKNYPLKTGGDLFFTVSTKRAVVIQQDLELLPFLKAPLAAGEQAGTIVISDSGGELYRVPMILEKDAARGNFFRSLVDNITVGFKKLAANFSRSK
jgi:D-alanyl-D-alanine carboxypeptidase (penicillin-binding protein 5/6)